MPIPAATPLASPSASPESAGHGPPRGPLRRAAAAGRPAADPACAGCAQLGVFRAVRRAGLSVAGASGCEPDGGPRLVTPMGHWAAVVGAARMRAVGAATILAEAWAAGARVLVLADRDGVEARRAAVVLRAARADTLALDGTDLAGAESLVRSAAAMGEAVLVALSPCVRSAPRPAALSVDAARCNRCGACLSLGCAAISDPGGEAMEIDPAVCNGCALCAPLCRGRAIR